MGCASATSRTTSWLNVKFAVERTLGLRVVQVNVNVQALRVSEITERRKGG